MKTKTLNLLTLSLIILFIANSCKKYEEGPSFTLLTVKQRLTGTWELKHLIVNDEEIDKNNLAAYGNEMIPDSLGINLEGIIINYIRTTFLKDGTGSYSISANIMNFPFSQSQQITWQLDDEKENITITSNGESITSEIIKLTKSEMWLRNSETNNNQTIITITKYEKIE